MCSVAMVTRNHRRWCPEDRDQRAWTGAPTLERCSRNIQEIDTRSHNNSQNVSLFFTLTPSLVREEYADPESRELKKTCEGGDDSEAAVSGGVQQQSYIVEEQEHVIELTIAVSCFVVLCFFFSLFLFAFVFHPVVSSPCFLSYIYKNTPVKCMLPFFYI